MFVVVPLTEEAQFVFHVLPLLVLYCHSYELTPVAVSWKLMVSPTLAVTLTGWVVMDGLAIIFTVLLVIVLSSLPVITHLNW